MNTHRCFGGASAALVALAVGVASTALGQPGPIGSGPPHRDAPRQLRAPRPVTPVIEVRPDGSIFEISAPVMPTFIVPDSGAGLPDGDPGIDGKPVGRPKLDNQPPIYGPDTRWDGPASEDLSAVFDARSQPLMQDFISMGPNGWTPPDPDAAVGFDYILAVTNDDFSVYDRCGNELYTNDINSYLGVGTDYNLFDPKVIFDPWQGKWVMMWHKKKVSTEEAALVVMITGGSTPFGLSGAGAYWYTFNMVQNAGTGDASWNDYYDLGYSNNFVCAAGNQFRFSNDSLRWGRLVCWDKAQIYAAVGAGTVSFSNLTNPDGSLMTTPRAVKNQSSWSEGGLNMDAMYINSRSGGGDKLTLRKLRDAFGANTLTSADIVTTAYVAPPSAEDADGSLLDTINCRLMTAVATNDTLGANGIELFTGLTTDFGTATAVHLFKIAPVTNALEFETRLWSTDNYYFYPSVAADYSGSAYWVFSYSSDVNNIFASARYVDYNQGVWSNASSSLRVGTGAYGGFRWGDYLGGQLDWGDYVANFSTPGRPAKVWVVGEYGAPGSWGTHIGATSVFTQGDLTAVSPVGLVVFTGPKGGPFAPASQNYTLTHAGETGVQVQVTSLPTWLIDNLNDTNADMYSTGKTVNLAVTASANSLNMGTYDDTVTFSDCFNAGAAFNRSVRLVVQAPDLDVVTIDAANGTHNIGQILNVTGQYHNNGNIATGAYSANFYLSSDTNITIFDEFIDNRNYASLGAGGTFNFNHNFIVPCVNEGLWYVGVIVTVTNDNNTADNVGHDATRIRVEYCPADYNNDCFVDGIDSDLFNNDFEAGNIAADYNGDGFVDGIDSDMFFNDFEAGC